MPRAIQIPATGVRTKSTTSRLSSGGRLGIVLLRLRAYRTINTNVFKIVCFPPDKPHLARIGSVNQACGVNPLCSVAAVVSGLTARGWGDTGVVSGKGFTPN